MYKTKLIIFLLIIKLSAFSQAVQPYPYKDNSMPWSLNIGDSLLKKTNPGAWLEVGDSLHSKKGILPPRGITSEILSPSPGLFIYDIEHKTIGLRNDTGWIYFLTTASGVTIDTSGKWITRVYRKTASDSVFYIKGGASVFAYKDSIGITDISAKLDITDTTAKWLTSVYRKTASDSVFFIKGGVATFAFKDSIGITDISSKLNISDTASMLAAYRTTASHSLIKTAGDFTLLHDTIFTTSVQSYAWTFNSENQRLQYSPTLNFEATDPLPGDIWVNKDSTGNTLINQRVPNQCQTRWVSGLDVTRIGTTHNFYVSPGQYYIGCELKTWIGGTVTLPDVDTASFQAYVIVDANGANVVPGDENSDPQLPSLNLDTQIPRASVLVNADNSINSTQVIIYDENTESAMSTGGSITANFASSGNTASGSLKIAITAAANNSYWQATKTDTLLLRSYDNLAFSIQNVATLNPNSNWSVQLYLGNTATSQELLITNYGYHRAIDAGGYQNIVIPTNAFTGGNKFNRVRVRKKGGNTVNTRFDLMYFDQGLTIINPQPGIGRLFARDDNGTTTNLYFNLGGHDFRLDSINKIVFTVPPTGGSDSAFVIKKSDGTVFFRADANLQEIFFYQFDVANGALRANPAALVFDNGYREEFGPNSGGMRTYQHSLKLERSYMVLVDSVNFYLTNDTLYGYQLLDSSLYHPFEVRYRSVVDNIERKKFWIRGDGVAQYAGDYSAKFTGCNNCIPSVKWIQDNISGGGGGGAAVWGTITGTLSDQTDLQAALDAIAYPGDSPDRITGIATTGVTANMAGNNFRINDVNNFNVRTATYTGGLLTVSADVAYLGDWNGDVNSNFIGADDGNNLIRVFLGSSGVFAYDHDGSANYTSLSLITKGDLDAAIAALSGSAELVATAANTGNYTITTGTYVILSDLTGQANRTVTLPTGVSGKHYYIDNRDASAFNWSFVGTVKDFGGSTITTLTDQTVYHLIYNGTFFQIVN